VIVVRLALRVVDGSYRVHIDLFFKRGNVAQSADWGDGSYRVDILIFGRGNVAQSAHWAVRVHGRLQGLTGRIQIEFTRVVTISELGSSRFTSVFLSSVYLKKWLTKKFVSRVAHLLPEFEGALTAVDFPFLDRGVVAELILKRNRLGERLWSKPLGLERLVSDVGPFLSSCLVARCLPS
jgi:hypothetical protein